MNKTLFDTTDTTLAESLLTRLDSKYAPAFARLTEEEQHKAALYFLPHASAKEIITVTRPRMIKWYCPFADQSAFPFVAQCPVFCDGVPALSCMLAGTSASAPSLARDAALHSSSNGIPSKRCAPEQSRHFY